jgi:hypothetical protein
VNWLFDHGRNLVIFSLENQLSLTDIFVETFREYRLEHFDRSPSAFLPSPGPLLARFSSKTAAVMSCNPPDKSTPFSG